jgi:hypothetical protein
MSTNDSKENSEQKTAAVTIPGTVEKIIPSIVPGDSEKAQITVELPDHLYRDIRIENKLKDEKGHEVELKEGAHVEVTVEAPAEDTKPKT